VLNTVVACDYYSVTQTAYLPRHRTLPCSQELLLFDVLRIILSFPMICTTHEFSRCSICSSVATHLYCASNNTQKG
jgi:hypothetical protein